MKQIPTNFVPQHRGDSLAERLVHRGRRGVPVMMKRPLIAVVAVVVVAFGLSACEDGGSPASDHINIHPRALHLWSRADGKPTMPDFAAMIGSI